MSTCRSGLLWLLCMVWAGTHALAHAQPAYPGLGRAATPAEVAAWDTDVRPDFKGLPAGSGSVAQGQLVWEAKCASCHGVFGESNEVFAPLVGGTTAADVKSGRVARLNDSSFPGRTTLMKLSTLSTLWDYIHRAMPWTQPRSLAVPEVYGVTAYMLHMAGVLPADFVLSSSNIADVQKLLPNRHGMHTRHGLWPGKGLGNGGKPDVQAVACMKNCRPAPTVVSAMPDHARNNHGNLAEQQRGVGPQRGVDTRQPHAAATAAPAPAGPGPVALALAQKHYCTACHGIERKIVGPGFDEIAGRYAGRADATAYLAGKIRAGGQGVWGAIPMPAQALPEADVQSLAQWLATGAGR